MCMHHPNGTINPFYPVYSGNRNCQHHRYRWHHWNMLRQHNHRYSHCNLARSIHSRKYTNNRRWYSCKWHHSGKLMVVSSTHQCHFHKIRPYNSVSICNDTRSHHQYIVHRFDKDFRDNRQCFVRNCYLESLCVRKKNEETKKEIFSGQKLTIYLWQR